MVRRLATGGAGAHAVLLYGARGSGKGTLANLLAQAWLCREPTEDGADGACRACMAFERGNSPDLLRIAPTGNSSIIKVNAITEGKPSEDNPTPLLDFFRTPPLLSRHKVVVIREAHRMNGDASNALLKTLEEPHPHARLVLTTTSVGAVLPTILSRCLGVACELPREEEVRRMFPEATEDDLRLAEGAPGRVQTILKRKERYRRIADFARGLAKRNPVEALVAAEEFRALCDGLDDESGARAANAEGLDLLASFLAREPGADPRWAQMAVEAHRRVVGNVSAPIVFDALFAAMLRKGRA